MVTGDNFGISEDVDIIQTDATSDVVSRHFHVQIKDEQDICKIKEPKVEVDREKTDQNFSRMQEIFDGIFPVKLTGRHGMWFTPWDNLIRWTGVEPVMYDLIERPEYIDALVSRFVDVSISLMEQYRKLKLWASNNLNQRVGSGGYGYTTALDAPDGLDTGADTRQLWGCGNAQIFSDVSEQMHWEFSLKHEIRWLKQFGLNYYGCCELLHNKMRILEKIPNLRKVSDKPLVQYRSAQRERKRKLCAFVQTEPGCVCNRYLRRTGCAESGQNDSGADQRLQSGTDHERYQYRPLSASEIMAME